MLSRLSSLVRATGVPSIPSTTACGALSARYTRYASQVAGIDWKTTDWNRHYPNVEDNVPIDIAEGVFKHFSPTSHLVAGWRLHLPQNQEGPLLLRRKDSRTLQKVFAHPMSMNIRWRDVESMLTDLGAAVEPCGRKKRHNASGVRVTLNGASHVFHNHALHDTNQLRAKEEILAIRRMLQEAGYVQKANNPRSH